MIYASYKKYLLEADDDENTGEEGGAEAPAEDTTTDNAEDTSDQGDENTEEGGDDSADTDDEYDIDDGGDIDTGGDDENGSDNTSDDPDTADTSEPGGDEEGSDVEIENPEFDQIYDKLTPEERANHDHELRQQYKKLYRSIYVTIEKTVKLPRTSQTLDATTSLLHTLFDFKKYLLFFINKQYEKNTLIQNTIEYYKFMSVLSAYKDVYKELEKALVHEES